MKHKQKTSVGLLLAISVIMFSFLNAEETQAIESLLGLDEKWIGNFDGMVKRHKIRALVPYSKTFYFLDGADQHGLTYEMLMQFEKYLNKQLKKKS